MIKYDSFPSGKFYCREHNKSFITQCPLCVPIVAETHPLIAYGKKNIKKEVSNNFHGKSRLINGKERRVIERFHSYRVRLEAKVDWVLVNGTLFNLRNNVQFKRLDFDLAFVQVFKKSILIVLRSKAEIKGLPVREAKFKADLIIKNIIQKLPKSIQVHDPKVSSLHNAFINHPNALRNVKVDIDREHRFISDNSKGKPEFEAIHPSFAISDSEAIEKDIISLVDKGLSRDFIASSLNALIQDRVYYAENLKTHVSSIHELGLSVRELSFLVKRRLK